jgi:hypothetical protein
MAFLAAWDEAKESNEGFKITIVPFSDQSLDAIFHSLGNDFDIMGSVCDITNWKSHYQFARLWDCSFAITLRREHPLAQRKRLKIQDLFGQQVLCIGTGTSLIIDSIRGAWTANYPRVRIVDYLPHYDLGFFNRCAEENLLGLSVDIWENIHPSLKTIPLDWDASIAYGIVYPLHPEPHILRFINSVEAAHLERTG